MMQSIRYIVKIDRGIKKGLYLKKTCKYWENYGKNCFPIVRH